ncbi:glycoside hydrolase family 3 protein [Cyathus striatus]|nr:glycoside hydrolase family 3 protein [Cyathus striatus]
MSRSFLDASIPELVNKLKVDEKLALLGAPNWWNTTSIDRLSIPSIRMSDGPNGVRGSSHFVSTPAQCIPCATALAATFDPSLVHQVGILLAEEAKLKSSVVLLAPTCNIQRTPLGGRSFESFSEDPHHSGSIMAAAFVNGLQSQGVAATIKHFVGNDQEHERTAADSVMSDRALREIYLYPFMLAERLARPMAYMTSYGRIKGVHCSENRGLLQGILRDEWKFKGIVISDWFGTYSVDLAINAGLDLEMPGPPRWRTPLLALHMLSCQKIHTDTIDQRVANLLAFVQKQSRKNQEIVYGDGVERSRDLPETRAFCRNLASQSIVLLKNENGTLPLRKKRVAVIGPNAKSLIISGGGSAALKPTYVITPWDGIKSGLSEECELFYHVGCHAHKYLPTLENYLLTPAGARGWLCTFYTHNAEGQPDQPIATFHLQDTRVKLNDFLPDGLTTTWSIKLTGKLTFETDGTFELGLTVAGRAKLWINNELTIDNWTKQTPGDFFYGQGTIEEKAAVYFRAGIPVDVMVEYTNTPPPDGDDEHGEGKLSQPALMRGVRFGGCEKIDAGQALEEATALATQVDSVVIIAGLSPEWESEGFDRPNLQLPGLQNELIERVCSANANTIICIQAGSAVSMPWVNKAAAILQTWYLGNETGSAISDVIFGRTNPSGRLPITFPVRVEDIPAHLNQTCENGKIHYREDLFVGYKHYQARSIKPLFPFGHGLSYTTFEFSDLTISCISLHNESIQVSISVSVKNTGKQLGSEVVQLYIQYPEIGLTTPTYQLKGFAKVHDIEEGYTATASIILDKYAFSYWDERNGCWVATEGVYGIAIGPSSNKLILQDGFRLEHSFTWSGL